MYTIFFKFTTILGLFIGISSFTFAAEKYDTTAFRTVTKLCSSCHGTAFYMAKQIDDDDWEFYFNTEGKLEKLHKNKPEGLSAVTNKKFKNRKKRLLKFFIANSKFSGAINGCDANFCGTNH
jgi:hypothetical protein